MLTFYVIKATSLNYPAIRHMAISWENVGTGEKEVIHFNEKGLQRELYDKFVQGRSIISMEEHQCSGQEQLLNYCNSYRGKKFNLLTNNCEMFVNGFLKECGENVIITSPQRDLFILIIVAVLAMVIYILIKKRITTKEKWESNYQNAKKSLSSALS